MKQQLRKEYLAKRNLLFSEQIERYSNQIFENVKKLACLNKTYFHIFLSIENKKEILTRHLVNYLFQENKQVVVPKINAIENKLMNCRLMPETFLTKNKWGIPEPDFCRAVNSYKIEVVFIPLLISDTKGNRVGYGKGFYDNLLDACSPEVIKVGLNFFEPIDSIIETHPHDVTLDFLVTPNKIYTYNF